MADGSIRKSERLKEISVRFVSDSHVHSIIQPLGNLVIGKNNREPKQRNITSDSVKKKYQNKNSLTALKEEVTKLSKATNSSNKKKKKLYLETSSEDDSQEEDSDIEWPEIHEKPTSLFEDDDVSGKQMFGFQTPKRRGAMALKASESASKTTPTRKVDKSDTVTPKHKKHVNGSKTPLSSRIKKIGVKENPVEVIPSKTPYTLRNRLKRKISLKLREALSSESEYSEEDSESDDTSQESESSSSTSEEDEAVKPITSRRPLLTPSVPASIIKRKKKDLNYVFTSDAYFESHANKVKTSDHTLSRLRTPRLTQDTMNSLLKNIPHSHEAAVRSLITEHMTRFNSWRFSLSQGFSILVYGLGSKRSLLNSFHKEVLSNSLVMVVNGFFPSLTVKEVVDGIAGDLLGLKNIPSQPLAAVAWIDSKLSNSSKRVFLIVHNLDGPMLRSEKAQTILSRLASIPRLHLIASVDHINCPLLWDHNKLSKFNFVWEDATSFLSYNEETSFETSLMVQRSGSLALASLSNVFRSLTKNAREIFKLLLEDSLSNKSNQKYIGIALSELYRQSRDAMLVTSDLALRTQLTEFLDHQLVKWRRDSDHLYIPIDSTILKQFQKELEESEL